jgi:hypothetical protein
MTAKNSDSISLASPTMLARRSTNALTGTPRGNTMRREKDDNILINEDKYATPNSTYADETKWSTRSNQKNSVLKSTSSIGSTSTASYESAGYCHDALSESSVASSIKRSFERLSKIDLSVDRIRHDSMEFSGGSGLYDREWSQEETDVLVAFANEYITRGGGDENGQQDNDGSAKMKRKT